ncbi:hypothetical protein BD324DRAFT_649531 [Kockovaella imperatae]|uniref:Uncharacterized protein n=1 Tax=Kockovaella imperatae TaxID=4999 RepID=A0A1Y1UN24_9TREE|nr:hypothetical protein BD324DRAFT_649531 [Kockovaella imperatae]ORX39458.1 hypothetical protein BD324DRAFT_649531 [Kockovaella imperatae]
MSLSLADELGEAFDSGPSGSVMSLKDELDFELDGYGAQHHGDDEEFAYEGYQDQAETHSMHLDPSPSRSHTISSSGFAPHHRTQLSNESGSTIGPLSTSLSDEILDNGRSGTPDPSDPQNLYPSSTDDLDGMPLSRSAFQPHKIEKDPIVILRSVLASTSAFRSSLASIDVPVSNSSRSVPSADRPFVLLSSDVEGRLMRLLEQILESDRRREDQCRELTILLRDSASVNWEGIDIWEIVGEDVINGPSDDDEVATAGFSRGVQRLGWTGDRRSPPQDVLENSWIAVRETWRPPNPSGLPNESSHELDPDQLMEVSDGPHQTVTNGSPLNEFSGTDRQPPSNTPALPRETAQLIRTSEDLSRTLASLTETAHSTSSLTTATARRIRGIRAGVESWREREAQEDAARVGVNDWERTRLNAGLGAVATTKDILDRELEGFRKALDHAGKRMETIRGSTRDLWRQLVAA